MKTKFKMYGNTVWLHHFFLPFLYTKTTFMTSYIHDFLFDWNWFPEKQTFFQKLGLLLKKEYAPKSWPPLRKKAS